MTGYGTLVPNNLIKRCWKKQMIIIRCYNILILMLICNMSEIHFYNYLDEMMRYKVVKRQRKILKTIEQRK